MDSHNSLLYRRAAVACAAIGIIGVIVGIAFYAGKHPNRGLAGVLIGVVLIVVGAGLAIFERRGRDKRPW
jgi:glucose uptake protein GlcU